MRGAPGVDTYNVARFRIIPADAGSTMSYPRFTIFCWDHPRGCGEHVERRLKAGFGQGSSPRMRGAPNRTRGTQTIKRIIPADAGSTLRSAYPEKRGQDHPRGCGEHW